MRSVIVHLMGGLGNQMFQYAAGRALAQRLGATLKLDVSAYASDPLRSYSLSPFNIQEQFATPAELAAIRRPYESRLAWYMQRLSRLLKLPFGWTTVQENHFRPFDPRFAIISGHVYLVGYWQSEKYFADMQELIRSECTLKEKPDAANREMAERIAGVQAVSLHIRRGDYVSNPHTNQIHGVCSLAYYQECVRRLAEELSRPHFFVFSDDAAWAQENLRLDYPTTFVAHNGPARPHEDLRLMTLCQYHILANSSFSWWGAWLNPNPDKIVYAPGRWFNDPTLDTRDLLPSGWIGVWA